LRPGNDDFNREISGARAERTLKAFLQNHVFNGYRQPKGGRRIAENVLGEAKISFRE
jgi:hypothetical protein